jgi:hypothetical protein
MLSLTPRARAHLWLKTIDAKCRNQLALAEHIATEDESIESLLRSALGPPGFSRTSCGLFLRLLVTVDVW